MRIVFMGTPDIAAGCLQKLIDDKFEIIGVVTQPDKPQNRGKKLGMPPVKELALKYNLPVYQPLKARDEEFVKTLEDLNPDVIVVVAFGQILPKYRGAAPINWVIINGEEKTGVTTMYMDEGLDTGDMILTEEFDLDDEITAGELHDKMTVIGAETLVKTLDLMEKGTAPRIPQNHDEFTYAPMMKKTLGHIDWNKSAREIHNLARGVNPWPGAYTIYNDVTMKVWKTKVLNETSDKAPGTILKVDKEGIKVSTEDKIVLIEEIQMPGKKRVQVSEYIKGNSIENNIVLG